MIILPSDYLKRMTDFAETAYPKECCGLLAGRETADGLLVTRLVDSLNVSASDVRDSFEVDPKVRFDLMRALEDSDGERIIGHYHSHPDHPAQPSARDLAMTYEPEFVWLIVSVIGGQAVQTTAHRLDEDRRRFHEIPLRTPEWEPYAEKNKLGDRT